jgi:hypothetical protein
LAGHRRASLDLAVVEVAVGQDLARQREARVQVRLEAGQVQPAVPLVDGQRQVCGQCVGAALEPPVGIDELHLERLVRVRLAHPRGVRAGCKRDPHDDQRCAMVLDERGDRARVHRPRLNRGWSGGVRRRRQAREPDGDDSGE